MELIAATLVFLAVVYAIAKAIGRTVLAPIHAKLDRLLALHEASAQPQNTTSSNPALDRSSQGGE